jgi:CheY-like chemotaxis protein
MMTEKRVLIVDDDPTVLQSLARALRALGVTDIVTVNRPQLAYEMIEDHPEYHWMTITDLEMAGASHETDAIKNGGELARGIRAINPTTAHVVLTTANTDYIGTEQCTLDGFDAILPKPVDPHFVQAQYQEFLKKIPG